MFFKLHNLTQLDAFDSILDARTPDEYALDHMPNAINTPTLTNEQRIVIGTMYKQTSAFEAKKHGGFMAARNIAAHIESLLLDKPKTWKPLVYCWRGGNRSGSMVTILRAIGWQAHQLEGGYKAYRRQVVETLTHYPTQLTFQVIGGPTGSGKSLLLKTLAQQGAQVLDLETLAHHRGSVLGRFSSGIQPTQKHFDSQLAHQLIHFDPNKPVFVEAESKKIGQITLPDALMQQVKHATIWRVELAMHERVAYLMRDYAEYIEYPDRLKQQLSYLRPLLGNETLNQYDELIDLGQFEPLIASLLVKHYDPLYQRATQQHEHRTIRALPIPDLSSSRLTQLAQQMMQT